MDSKRFRSWRISLLLGGCLLLPALLLSGCGAVVVTGVAAGAAVLHDRRNASTVLADSEIEYQAAQIYFAESERFPDCRISTTSYNRIVLLTGQCGSESSARAFAERIRQLPEVRQVLDEIQIGPLASLGQESEDLLIHSRVSLALAQVNHGDFDLTRVNVVVESGVVYLMGLLTPQEARAVVEQVRHVPGVKKVVQAFEYLPIPQ